MMNVKVGEYEVIQDSGGLTAYRYGQSWRDCTGDNLILSLCMEIERLRKAEELLGDIIGNECVSFDHEERYKELYPE